MANAECACDQDGLKYMQTGSELANQIPSVARNAHSSATIRDITSCELKGKPKTQKPADRGTECHRNNVGARKTVCLYVSAKRIGNQNARVGEHEKR